MVVYWLRRVVHFSITTLLRPFGGVIQAMTIPALPATISVEQAGKLLGLSRSSAYRAAARGQLPTIVFGRRRLVPTARLLEMLGVSIEEQS
jgi:excisionase family DNA binding protein